MSLLVLVLLSFAVCVASGSGAEYVPVVMWGATAGAPRNTRGLTKVRAADFGDLLTEQLDSRPFTVVFVEEALSVEDLSGKDARGRTPYPGLREKLTGDSVIYYPFVASALHTLNKLADPEMTDRVQLTEDGLSADITPGPGQFLYISLKDAREGEDRMHMLSRHDQFMTEMFDKLLKKHDSMLAIYTARQPSWEVPSEEAGKRRVARATENGTVYNNLLRDENGTEMFYNVTQGRNMFVYAMKMTILDSVNSNYSVSLQGGTARTVPNETEWEHIVYLDFDNSNSVKLVYTIGNDSYWTVEAGLKMAAEDIDFNTTIYAAYGFSYHCSPVVNFTSENNSKVLSIEDFQTQVFFDTEYNERFNLAYDCVGFTSVPIWSGLFIAFLLIFITAIGITMMMDIRTMDRFDDPKGKTITITTAE